MSRCYGYIYITTNLVNRKIYIGQKSAPDGKQHPTYLGSGLILKRAISKNGRDSFSVKIIEWCETEESLNEREVFWIAHHHSTNPEIGYNISDGGAVPRMSGIHNPMYGKTHTLETREFLRQNSTGVKASASTIEKMKLIQ